MKPLAASGLALGIALAAHAEILPGKSLSPPIVTSGPPATTPATTASFTFASGASGNFSYQCSLDGGAETGCTSPQVYSGLEPGKHSFAVETVRVAVAGSTGGIASEPATFDWTVTNPELRLSIFATGRSFPAFYQYLAGVAVDGSGNVYVANSVNPGGTVARFSPDGSSWSQILSIPNPYAVAVDNSGGVYVGAWGGVTEILPSGAAVAVDTGSLTIPYGIVFDGAGNMYVAGAPYQGQDYVEEIAPNGTRTLVGSGFCVPSGVALDKAGNLYVTDSCLGQLFKETPNGSGGWTQSVVAGIGSFGKAEIPGPALSSPLDLPVGVAVDDDGALYVIDRGEARPWGGSPSALVKVTPDGQLSILNDNTSSACPTAGLLSASHFTSLAGIANDGQGNLLVTDYNCGVVARIAVR